jgi:hypothetical protein
MGICPKGEFLMLSDELDRASQGLELAHAELDEHIKEHCCLTYGSTAPE